MSRVATIVGCLVLLCASPASAYDVRVDGALTPDSVSLVGDYDGDGLPDLGVWLNGWFYIMGSRVGPIVAGFTARPSYEDQPIALDFDGDGWTDIAFFVPATREYFILPSSGGHQFLVICTHLWDCWAWPYVKPAAATAWWGDPQPVFGWPRPYHRVARP